MKMFGTRLVAVALAFGCSISTLAAQVIEKPKLTLASASLSSMGYLPMQLAQRFGYFKDEGLTVEIAGFQGGSKALESLIGGSADIAVGAFSNVVTMAAKGQYLKVFINQLRYPTMCLTVNPTKAATMTSLKDLKGSRIGVSAPGSSSHMVLLRLLSTVGLKTEDVSIIGVGTGATAIAAFTRGDIDAISATEPVTTRLTQSAGGKLYMDTRTEKGTLDLFGGPFPEASFYAKADFIEKNPNTIQAVTNAVVKAEQWLQKATAEEVAAAVPPEFLLGDRDLYLASFAAMREGLSPDGRISKLAAEIVMNEFALFLPGVKKLKDSGYDVTRFYDMRFVENALKKHQ